jgi:hypothetical protein
VGGVPYTGIVEINIEESREGELQYGQRTDGTPLGITSGLYAPGAFTFKAYIDTAEMITNQLGILGLGSFGSVLFPFILEVFENPLLPTLQILINGCKIEKRKVGVPTDSSGLMVEFECKYLSMQTVGEGIGLTGIPSILANYASITTGI